MYIELKRHRLHHSPQLRLFLSLFLVQVLTN
nr:MAG TPA: hypothetical protein [Bacteriophage sp.]